MRAAIVIAVLVSIAAVTGHGSVRALAAPAAGSTGGSYQTPLFRWSAVGGADHYEFEMASDSAFNSPALGGAGHFSTQSTIATLNVTIPDGTYYWRVRAVGKNGSVSPWRVKSLTKKWSVSPQLVAPADNASIAFPSQPLLLTWRPILGAVKYEVSIAHDAALTSLISQPASVTTNSYIPSATLADGTYFWAVVPVDAEGHEGRRSAVRSFRWSWPTATQTSLRDLVDAPELFDPLLSWTPVPGAAKYEIDVNFSQDFNSSSRVCCSSTVLATGYSPSKILPNNQYFWRVRPINADGADGVWTQGQNFTKTFDNVPPVAGTSISGLHMRDEFGDGGAKPAGWSTSVPILVWNPVPGASAYDMDIFDKQGNCDYTLAKTKIHIVTPLTAWTPYGTHHGTAPVPATGVSLASDGTSFTPGTHYCVRIRAEGDEDTSGKRIYGDYTYLNDAFTYAASGAAGGSLGNPAYISPAGGTLVGQTPLYTWNPVPGANSYWVLVSRDSSFTTLVDYAFTQIPAYAPRRTIADETTSYYWLVIPASNANGTGVLPFNSGLATTFQKRSTPPTLLQPTKGAELAAIQPQFQWTPVQGAKNYRVQVSTDPNFGKTLDNVTTSATSYVSNTKYPAQSTLYWRVQANDDAGTALTWSDVGTFKFVLPTPQPLAPKKSQGESTPAWQWAPVKGATAYDVRVIVPGGRSSTFSGIPTPATVPTRLGGTGTFRWQVRADFSGSVSSPYSPFITFKRTVTPPKGAHVTISGRTLLFSWQGRPGLAHYVVQVATRPDFSGGVDTEKTDGTFVAPNMTQYKKGGLFYYHVAATDGDGNTSGWSPSKTFRFGGTGR